MSDLRLNPKCLQRSSHDLSFVHWFVYLLAIFELIRGVSILTPRNLYIRCDIEGQVHKVVNRPGIQGIIDVKPGPGNLGRVDYCNQI